MKFSFKLYILVFLLFAVSTLQNQLAAQPFTPDKYGYVKDPKFHKLIKEKGYELVADFHKVESGNDSLYASVYIKGEWKYINTYGDLKTTLFNYQKHDDELELYTREYSGSDFYDEAVEMPRMENSKPYSSYSITKPSGKKWGTVHTSTKAQGLPFTYDRISFFSPTIVTIQKDKKFGLAYCTGKIIVPPTYENLSSLNHSSQNNMFLVVKLNNKYGIIDTIGKITVPIIYDRLNNCNDCGNNLIKISTEGKWGQWGLINLTNKIILPIIYSEITPLYNNIIRVKTLSINKSELIEKYGLIDSEGNFILDTTQDQIEKERYSSYIKYRKNGLEGLLTNEGKPFVAPIYNNIERFNNGYAIVKKNFLLGLINKKGKEIIPTQYKVLYPDSKRGLIKAMDSTNKWGYINYNHKVKMKFVYDELVYINGDAYFFKLDGEYGLMTSKEVVFKKFKYKKMYKSGDFYVVEENNLSGIIDENGNILLPIKYAYIKDAHDFYQHGYCKVRINGKYYGVDRYGNEALLAR